MIVVEHLSFNFGEKVSFVNYFQRELNHVACRVSKTTFIHTLLIFIKKKGKKRFEIFFKKNFNGRVSICSNIKSDH